MLSEILITIAAWGLILGSAWTLGRPVRPWLSTDTVLNGILVLGTGIALLSFLMLVLNAFGWISSPAIWTLLGILFLAGLRHLPELFSWITAWRPDQKPSFFSGAFLLLLIVSSAALLLGTLTPEIGGDALTYHINVPQWFLKQGSLNPIRFDANSYYPGFMYNLYVLGLATGGILTAKLFHFVSGGLLALLVGRILVLENTGRTIALFTALAVWVTPAFYNQFSTTYVDGTLAFYTLAALWIFLHALESRKKGAFLLAGFLLGCSISIKYLGLYSAIAIGVIGLLSFFNHEQNKMILLRNGWIWTAGILAGCGYWLVRNWLLLSNPFYPFFGRFFAGTAQRPPSDHHLFGTGHHSGLDFLLSFWNMFWMPNQFGSFTNRIGIAYLFFFPLLLIAAALNRRARPYTVFSMIFLIFWYEMSRADRWMMPVLPVLAVGGALGLHALRNRLPERWKKSLLVTAGLCGFLITGIYTAGGLYHYRFAYPLVSGFQSRAAFLETMERTYPAAQWVNENLPADAKLFVESEPRRYYFQRPTVRDSNLRWETGYPEKKMAPEAFARFLASHDITHAVVTEPLNPKEQRYPDADLRRLVASPFARHLETIESRNTRDGRYRYSIYEILPSN